MTATHQALTTRLLVPRRCTICRKPIRGKQSTCVDGECGKIAKRIKRRLRTGAHQGEGKP